MMAQSASEKITLEDVVFRYMLDLSQSAAKIRTSLDLDYQKNADNYYFQVLTLWSILEDYIDEPAKRDRIMLLLRAEAMYKELVKEGEAKPAMMKARRDQVVSLTFSVASKTLSLMSKCLSKKGILRERSAQSVAGEGQLRDVEEVVVEERDEEGVILGGTYDVPPTTGMGPMEQD
jgi:hypothetical protein